MVRIHPHGLGVERLSGHDATVVGSGPNGLAAAIVLARTGHAVQLVEARDTLGGGMRSAELTRPGFVHDICSAIHPMALGSPFLRDLPLAEHGLDLIQPGAPLAHPLDGGGAVMLERSVEDTADGLGADGGSYRRLMAPLADAADAVIGDMFGPIRLPRHPISSARFGLAALRSADGLARARFETERARALFAGIAAHSMLPLTAPTTAAAGLVLGLMGHAFGWPLARGGSQQIAEAMASYLRELGGEIVTSKAVSSLDELPGCDLVMLDLTPRQVLRIAGARLPDRYRRTLGRYRYGPGVCKLDWALDGPVPWTADECGRAATAHLGGTLEGIAHSEQEVWHGRHAERPYVLFAQQTPFDSTRAPAGKHTAWAYCHVPAGSDVEMTDRIEAQVERFAPGFRDLIIDRSVITAAALERYNANYVGGDINGGVQDLRQLFTRPAPRPVPYATPVRGLYICSSSTPPGGGVHGLCGYFAAQAALRRLGTRGPKFAA